MGIHGGGGCTQGYYQVVKSVPRGTIRVIIIIIIAIDIIIIIFKLIIPHFESVGFYRCFIVPIRPLTFDTIC